MKKIICTVLVLAVIIALLATSGVLVYNAVKSNTMEIKNPTVTFEIENYGKVKLELYPEYAPNTVQNIIALAENGYYNEKVLYGKDSIALYVGRNVNGDTENPKLSLIDKSVPAMIGEGENQTVNPDDYEYEIDGEFAENNFKQNKLVYEKGAVSMVRLDYSQQNASLDKEGKNSASSQFTIAMDTVKELSSKYTVFGKVVEGMDVVENIYNNVELKPSEDPDDGHENASIKQFASYPKIISASVEKFDVDYGMPTVHKAFNYTQYIQDMYVNNN